MVKDDFRSILRRAGNVLIAVGIVDVGVMVVCILTVTPYSSSLNVFAIVAGIMLRRGSLGAATWVARISALMLGMAPVGLAASFIEPWHSLLSKQPELASMSYALMAVMVILALWLLRELRRKPVLDAMVLTRTPQRPPYIAALVGLVGFGSMCLLVHHLMDTPTAHRAVEVARATYGPQYEYTVTRIAWTSNRTTATLTAHNDHESKEVTVSFDTP